MTAFEIIYILQVPLLFLAATIVGSMLIVEIIESKEQVISNVKNLLLKESVQHG